MSAPRSRAAAPKAAPPAATKTAAKKPVVKSKPADRPAARPTAKQASRPTGRTTTPAVVEPIPAEGDTVFPEPVAPAAPVAEEDVPLALDEAPPGIDLVKAYLREIGRVALLTAEMEVDLAKRVEAGLFANEKLRQHTEGET
ncbi:MAG: polymerase primary sigma factor, partial [Actinomycetota bacterium]|nr:polymerase primary sigma factor [Actinomycetota bacterium]